jgi:hypothetical protein
MIAPTPARVVFQFISLELSRVQLRQRQKPTQRPQTGTTVLAAEAKKPHQQRQR